MITKFPVIYSISNKCINLLTLLADVNSSLNTLTYWVILNHLSSFFSLRGLKTSATRLWLSSTENQILINGSFFPQLHSTYRVLCFVLCCAFKTKLLSDFSAHFFWDYLIMESYFLIQRKLVRSLVSRLSKADRSYMDRWQEELAIVYSLFYRQLQFLLAKASLQFIDWRC